LYAVRKPLTLVVFGYEYRGRQLLHTFDVPDIILFYFILTLNQKDFLCRVRTQKHQAEAEYCTLRYTTDIMTCSSNEEIITTELVEQQGTPETKGRSEHGQPW
jgi:hypothetical protein